MSAIKVEKNNLNIKNKIIENSKSIGTVFCRYYNFLISNYNPNFNCINFKVVNDRKVYKRTDLK